MNEFEKKLLRQMKRAKVKVKYESEKIPYILARHYIPDFVITTAVGKIYIEAKGYLRPEHKAKMVAVKKLHPAMDIRIVFYSKKPKDIKWAEKHKFLWAIETIPKEWLDDKGGMGLNSSNRPGNNI